MLIEVDELLYTSRRKSMTNKTSITSTISLSPTGEDYPLPVEADHKTENDRLAALFAECNGVDLPKIVEAIKVRPTHSNMIFPGPVFGLIGVIYDK